MNTPSVVKKRPQRYLHVGLLGFSVVCGCTLSAQAAVPVSALESLQSDWVRSTRPPITVNIQRPNVRVQPDTVPGPSSTAVAPSGLTPATENARRASSDNMTALVVDADKSRMRSWTVELADSTIRLCLKRWAKDAGWQLVWDARRDFIIDAEVSFYGTFEQALGSMMQSLSDSEYPLQARLNTDTKVVRIQRLAPSQAR